MRSLSATELQPLAVTDEDASGGPSPDAETLRRRWVLVLPHREDLLRIARRRVHNREDAEDVVATALVRTVEHPRLDEARVGAFLCTTVMRLSVDTHRDRTRQLAVGKRAVTRELPTTPADEVVCDEAEARWLRQQLLDIPARERQVLQARLLGLSAQETSAHLGLSAKATENAYTRVRQRAQAALTATLAGLGVLIEATRRLGRPSLVMTPVAVAVGFVGLALTFSSPSAPAMPVELDAERSSGSPSLTVPRSTVAPTSPTAISVRPAPRLPEQQAAVPVPTLVVQPPLAGVVPRDVLDPGDGVRTGFERPGETLSDSIEHCLSGLALSDPTADPCAQKAEPAPSPSGVAGPGRVGQS